MEARFRSTDSITPNLEDDDDISLTAQKMKFSIKDFFRKWDQDGTADLVTFTEEILNGKLHFLCSAS